MRFPALEQIDFYKADHRRQYPALTELVYSNMTARSNKLSNIPSHNNEIVFFGLQYFIKDFLQDSWNETFFKRPKAEVVAEYKLLMDSTLGAGAIPVEHIEALHDLGYLPLEIRALPEGAVVDMRVPFLTIHNTDKRFYWLVNYLESVMSCYLWKPIVSATTARWYKRCLLNSARITGAPEAFVPFQAHDFSFRGMSGPQDAASSGAAHLTSFVGTDTVPSIRFHETFYGADKTKELIGTSVPATEHSVMCAGGKESEEETFLRLFNLYQSGIVSIVSDTWDFWNVVTNIAAKLKPQIMARTAIKDANGNIIVPGKVVFRPDSGDPVEIICGCDIPVMKTLEAAKDDAEDRSYDDADCGHGEPGQEEVPYLYEVDGKYYHIVVQIDWNRHDKQYYYQDGRRIKSCVETTLTPAQLGAVRCLWNTFGGTVNANGFKELDSHVGIIYGDSITPQRAEAILKQLAANGFASSNIVFGVGSFTYNYATRDTIGLAMKATYVEINGVGHEIFKDPVTDNGIKKSAKGLLAVRNGKLYDQQPSWDAIKDSDLKTVFLNGVLVKEWKLSEIRDRVNVSLEAEKKETKAA